MYTFRRLSALHTHTYKKTQYNEKKLNTAHDPWLTQFCSLLFRPPSTVESTAESLDSVRTVFALAFRFPIKISHSVSFHEKFAMPFFFATLFAFSIFSNTTVWLTFSMNRRELAKKNVYFC